MSEPPAGASGPKLTVQPGPAPAETPSAQLIRKAIEAETLDCDDGRKLHVRKPSPLAQFQITEAAGPAVAMNAAWMQMVQPLIYLGAIEGAEGRRDVPMPQNKTQIEALILELGDPGMDALLLWYGTRIMAPMMAAMDNAEREANKAALKNG